MRLNDLSDQLRQKPFQPFRLHLTDGTVFDVSHPDLAIAGHAILRLSLPPALGLPREAVIDLLHIMWLEVIVPRPPPETASAGEGSGEPSPSQ